MKIIAVVGPGTCDEATSSLARNVGRVIAGTGSLLICGGLGGVMAAACQGAVEFGGTTIGVLPGAGASEANPWVKIPIVTGLGEARNAVIARTAHAMIALGGEYGTLSEIAFALKFGIPVIGLGTWQISRGGRPDESILLAESPAQAVPKALDGMAQ